jgi:Na+/H+ antiporter NhaD/arsenite permease-like protein
LLLAGLAWAGPAAAESGPVELGQVLPAWSTLPFAGMLLSIALVPLLAPRFWHHHYPKVSAVWAAVFLLPFLAAYRGPALGEVLHVALVDYVPFLILLGALFTIGGGIHVRGTLRGSPPVNAAIIAVGTVIASLVGTTGAAMLMIRPLLRANRERRHRAHTVVFFIFLVANIGGSLTPLGDPPLFLGFLHGVPFFWTLRLWPETLLVAALLLAAYLALDAFHWRREDATVRARSEAPHEPLRIEGWHNFLLLAGVLAAVIASGLVHGYAFRLLGVDRELPTIGRDLVLVLLAWISWRTTPGSVRQDNDYSWAPIREVAILFAGIFATIIPALAILRAGEAGALGLVGRSVQSPADFFWASGTLSSFLDNAPTYLTFLSTEVGRFYPGLPERAAIARLIADHPIYLKAISLGAVFMGANTYIGNAPNFMVKSIAEEAGVAMPSFFGYIARYTVPFLLPAFVAVTLLFFR